MPRNIYTQYSEVCTSITFEDRDGVWAMAQNINGFIKCLLLQLDWLYLKSGGHGRVSTFIDIKSAERDSH
jgi:hypothetical protein